MKKKIYVVTAEYQHGEDDRGIGAGDEYYLVLAAFEDEADADAFYEAERDADEELGWGNFYVKQQDGRGWSDTGWWLTVVTTELHTKTKGRRKTGNGREQELLKVVNRDRRRRGQAPLKPGEWPLEDLEEFAARVRNPGRGDAALAAGLGSLVGGAVGGVLGPAGQTAGSVLGGMYGGDRYAPQDRRGRSRIGSGIGGVFGPIGAALGSYIGTRKPDKRQRNPWAYELARIKPEEREQLHDLMVEAQRARVKAALAESRGETREATKWRKKEEEADLELLQLEERLHLFETERYRPNAARSSAGGNEGLKRKLMGE